MKVKVTAEFVRGDEFKLAGKRNLTALNPKELLLYAAATCAGKTVVGILDKERITPQTFEVTLSGEIDTDTVVAQSRYTTFNVAYNVACKSIDEQPKVSRAINLANEKYCGLIQMLRKIAPVSHEIAIVSTETVEA